MYLGAGSLIDPELARKLDSRKWAFQPKIDGGYATVTTDANGAILSAISRSGRRWSLLDLKRIRTLPSAVLCCEIEQHTEAANEARRTRGYSLLHVFDAISLGGRELQAATYAERYQAITRAIAQQEVEQGEWFNAAGRHRGESGRYRSAPPVDVRRTPLVPMLRGVAGFDELWTTYVERAQGEGLVAVRLDAPMGKRGAKRKIKTTDTISARLSPGDPSGKSAFVHVYGQSILVAMPGWAAFGDVVDIAHNGFYNTGEPRFARVVRQRSDLN